MRAAAPTTATFRQPRPARLYRPRRPPRSSGELLGRLDRNALVRPLGGPPSAPPRLSFKAEQVDACRQRYDAFFDAIAGQLDGGWAFEDTDCGYLLLNELLYGEETSEARPLPARGLQAVRRRAQASEATQCC